MISFQVAAILLTLLFLAPLAWTVSASLRQPGLPPPASIEWLPSPIAWQNYAELFRMLPFGRYILNTLLVTAYTVPVTLLVASWAGFAISQLGRRLQRGLVIFTVGMLMVPVTSLWLTRYLLFDWLGLVDTFGALLAPALMGSSPLFILLFYWSFRRIPLELGEAARLDGANAVDVWRRIYLPLARPTALAVVVLTTLLTWNDFINPLLYLKSQQLYTLAVGLRQLQQLDQTNWPMLMAGAVVMIVPPVLLFLLVQRYFLKDNPLEGIFSR
jgi:multiple sugar transport system permease protein